MMPPISASATAPDSWERLVTILGHSLWQGLLIALLLKLLLQRLPVSRPRLRYGAALAAMTVLLVAPMITWSVLGSLKVRPAEAASAHSGVGAAPDRAHLAPPLSPPPNPSAPPVSFSPAAADASVPSAPASSSPRPWAPVLAGAWVAGVLIMLLRLTLSFLGAGRLVRSSCPVKDSGLKCSVEELRCRLGVRMNVGVHLCEQIASPAVVGVFRPLILLPVSWATAIPSEDLKAILAHELAHVRRHDYLVNLGQMIVEALLFFNPAVWWISRRVRLEREACCDFVAGQLAGSAAEYAAVLERSAALRGRPGVLPAIAPAHAPGDQHSLLDRVRRLLLPGHQPEVHLPWYTLATSLAAWGGILVALWAGSSATVAIAARMLTPQERLEQVTEQDRKFGVPEWQADPDQDHQTTISGTFRAADPAASLPRHVNVTFRIQNPRSSHWLGATLKPGPFAFVAPAGRLHVTSLIPGWAPILQGPWNTEPGQTLEGLDLVFEKGYSSEILVTDPDDQPVSGAVVQLTYAFPDEQNGTEGGREETGETGTVLFPNVADHRVKVKVNAPGFEPRSETVPRLPADGRLPITLRRAMPARGIVIDAATSQPISGAVLRMAMRRGPEGNYGFQYHQNSESVTTAAVTGQDGRFELDRLRDDTRYGFVVEAPPRRLAYLPDVKAGATGLQVAMGEPLYIRGTVTGPREKLTRTWMVNRGQVPTIYVRPRFEIPGENSHFTSRNVPVEFRDGIGHFYVDNFFEGTVKISAGSNSTAELPLTSPIDGLELSVEETTSSASSDRMSTRAVVLRFETPPGAPPRGTMRLSYKGLSDDPNSGPTVPVSIPGREFRFTVITPSGVSYAPWGTLGYWFKDGGFQVPAGEDEYVHSIPVLPAGAISGTVTDREARPISHAHLTVSILDKPEQLLHEHSLVPDQSTLTSQGTFNLTPLILDATWQVRAGRGNTIAMSDGIVLDAATPTRHITLQLPEGESVEGIVRNEQGEPLAGVPFQLLFRTPGFESNLESGLTDRNGRFSFSGLNPDVDGKYELVLPLRKEYQPARLELRPGGAPLEIVLQKGTQSSGR